MKNNKLLPFLITAALLAAVVLYGLYSVNLKTKSYDVVVFGDSIIGNDREETSVTAKLAEKTGLSVFNAGIGGTKLSRDDSDYGLYSMVSLSEDMAKDDFTAMLCDDPEEYFKLLPMLSYAPDTIREIARIDYEKASYIVIEQGINDYLGAVPLQNEEDPEDEKTFAGALTKTIRNVREAAPQAKLILVSPMYTNTAAGSGDSQDFGFGTTESYVACEKEICDRLGVTFVDAYHESGINKDNYEEYLSDSLHTNEAGNEILAGLIQKAMEQ